MMEMAFLPTATVSIIAWNPEAKEGFKPECGHFNFYDGMDAAHTLCNRPIQKALRKGDADDLAAWICAKASIQSVQISYAAKPPTHDRFMHVSYMDEKGHDKKTRIV